ncbi:hypothetical protein KIN20_034096 [Parelaphostrongylus tenuis]|uniref:Lipoprotein n=1 Tax=Parelaphostrongylus tenuis TaxID=148309 RepID=A0AAD5WJS6_PARTN|nr:hypothetical protein KIN20_034096 [Parelaphostrongylus tenuis]
MARLLNNSFVISLLSITAVLGCGVMPPGQARTRNFTVTGFALPVNMVCSNDATVRAKHFSIAASSGEVQALISRLLMQTAIDVLEQQGRSALLPDAIISSILSQLSIQISYDPLECKGADVDPTANIMPDMAKLPHCVIVGSTVTSLCEIKQRGHMCRMA